MARPPSAEAHVKVLDAAAELVAERGIDATSMDAIARKSGVSKATIYNHWPDKEALVLEMLAHIHQLTERPSFASGKPRADAVAALAYQPEGNQQLKERITPHLVAYSAKRKEFGLAWRNAVMEPLRRDLRRILKQAGERGELRKDLDLDVSMAMLVGPMMYRFIFQGKGRCDQGELAGTVVAAFWKAFAA